MTRKEYNQLPSDGKVACPDCGLKLTQPYPGCGCPSAGLYTKHINEYHHNCEDAWKRAYPINKNNIGTGGNR